PAIEGSLEQVRVWVETLTGAKLDASGAFTVLDLAELDARRRRLAELGGPPAGSATESTGTTELHAKEEEQRRYANKLQQAALALEDGRREFARSLLDQLKPRGRQVDPRGFEWHFLRGLCEPASSAVIKLTDAVRVLAVHP